MQLDLEATRYKKQLELQRLEKQSAAVTKVHEIAKASPTVYSANLRFELVKFLLAILRHKDAIREQLYTPGIIKFSSHI